MPANYRDIYEIADSDEERVILPKPTNPWMFAPLDFANPPANVPATSGSLRVPELPTSSPKRSRPLTILACFSKLPIELRTKIWDGAMPGPRIVEIYASQFEWKGYQTTVYASKTPVPVILHVNQESRRLGRKRYTLLFGCPGDRIFGQNNTIYLDLANDIPYLRSHKGFDPSEKILHWQLNYLIWPSQPKARTYKLLTRLALPIGYAANDCYKSTIRYLAQFPKLAEIILVGDDVEITITDSQDENFDTVRPLCGYDILDFIDAEDSAAEVWDLCISSMAAEFIRAKSTRLQKTSPIKIHVKVLTRKSGGAFDD